MSDLKRKRGLLEGDRGSADGANMVSYFNNLPEGLMELADVKLLVEAKELFAHSFVLTRSSPVLQQAKSRNVSVRFHFQARQCPA